MKTFTYGSDDAVQALKEDLPDRYPMELSRNDMKRLIDVLHEAHSVCAPAVADKAGDFLASIAVTLDHDWV